MAKTAPPAGRGACARPHPAFLVAFIAFWVLFTAGGVRATPSLLTVSWEKEFGWTRALISGAVSINVLLYGVLGPFAAAAFDLASLRVIATCALVLLCIGMGLTLTMGVAWHLYLLVGLALGFGSGTIATVTGKVIVNRWFAKGTGLAMGLFSASAQTGQVILAPLLGFIVERHGWRAAAATVAGVAGLFILPTAAFLYNHPADVGALPFGAEEPAPASAAGGSAPAAVIELPAVEQAAPTADGIAAASGGSSSPVAPQDAPDVAAQPSQPRAAAAAAAAAADGGVASSADIVAAVADRAALAAVADASGAAVATESPDIREQDSGSMLLAAEVGDRSDDQAVAATPVPPAVAATPVPPAAATVLHVDVGAGVSAPLAVASSDAIAPAPSVPQQPPDALATAAPRQRSSALRALSLPLVVLWEAAHYVDFWLLAGSFFVCGASTVGLIGAHLIPACMDHGMAETESASFLAAMGVLDIAGTLMSGFLTDRFDGRLLLSIYYGFRGIALVFLPWAFDYRAAGLWPFAILYGLDWIATVPPTTALCTACFGKAKSAMIFGWAFAAHQVGASIAAAAAGFIRTEHGSYYTAFWGGGVLCLIASAGVLAISKRSGTPPTGKPASGSASQSLLPAWCRSRAAA